TGGDPPCLGGEHHVLRRPAGVELVTGRFLDDDDRGGRVPHRVGEVSALGQSLQPVPLRHDDEGPVLLVLRASRPPGGFQNRFEVVVAERLVGVGTEGTQGEDEVVDLTAHVLSMAAGAPLGLDGGGGPDRLPLVEKGETTVRMYKRWLTLVLGASIVTAMALPAGAEAPVRIEVVERGDDVRIEIGEPGESLAPLATDPL